jgi:hypothetical protein
MKVTAGDRQRNRRSEESRRKKKPEMPRYVPKGRLEKQQQQQSVTDASGEGSGDWEDDMSSPSPKTVHSPSPGPTTSALLHAPQSPSPRKIDLKNMQVTVVNNKSDTGNRVTPEKNVEQPVKTGNRNTRNNEQDYSKGHRGQGQSYSRGRGQRHNQRSNARQNDGRNNRGLVGNRNETKEQRSKVDNREIKQENVAPKQDDKPNVDNKQNKDVKNDQELYIVPSRPSTIGQEADRKDTVPVGMEENKNKIDEKPGINKQQILERFRRTPNKTKSRSYDKLNQSERFEDEDGYYPDPQNLGTMVFERSHSSEQLNLSGRNVGKPPMPRSSSGSGAKNVPRKHGFSGMRKRTDSISSDLSTGMTF